MVYFWISCFSILSTQAAHRTDIKCGYETDNISSDCAAGTSREAVQKLFSTTICLYTQQCDIATLLNPYMLSVCAPVYEHTCAHLHLRDIKILQELMEQILVLFRERSTLAIWRDNGEIQEFGVCDSFSQLRQMTYRHKLHPENINFFLPNANGIQVICL